VGSGVKVVQKETEHPRRKRLLV